MFARINVWLHAAPRLHRVRAFESGPVFSEVVEVTQKRSRYSRWRRRRSPPSGAEGVSRRRRHRENRVRRMDSTAPVRLPGTATIQDELLYTHTHTLGYICIINIRDSFKSSL